jgi:hypothetical protein
MTDNQVWVKALRKILPLSAVWKVHKMLEDFIDLATAAIHIISITFYWMILLILQLPQFISFL